MITATSSSLYLPPQLNEIISSAANATKELEHNMDSYLNIRPRRDGFQGAAIRIGTAKRILT